MSAVTQIGPIIINNVSNQAPIVVGAATECPNLNAALLQGASKAFFQNASNLLTGTLTASLLPNSGVSAGSYNNVVVDEKGRVTSASFISYASASHTHSAADITSGTLNLARVGSQNANRVLAGPTSGSAATPTFRSLVATDLASSPTAAKVLHGDMTWKTPSSGMQGYVYDLKTVNSYNNGVHTVTHNLNTTNLYMFLKFENFIATAGIAPAAFTGLIYDGANTVKVELSIDPATLNTAQALLYIIPFTLAN